MGAVEQGLQVTGIGMGLVFLSLVVVAGLIWALGKVFPGSRVTAGQEAEQAPEEVATVEEAPAAVSSEAAANQAAAIAVALVRQGLGAATRVAGTSLQRSYMAMPWERPAELWGEELLQGEMVTVISVDPGSGNWKSQGRLAAMQ